MKPLCKKTQGDTKYKEKKKKKQKRKLNTKEKRTNKQREGFTRCDQTENH